MPLQICRDKSMRLRLLASVALGALLVVSSPCRADGPNEVRSVTNLQADNARVNKAASPQQRVKIIPADSDYGVAPPPPTLEELQGQMAPSEDSTAKENAVGLQIRADALREAALSYGARGGLASRTFEIQRRLAEYETSMSKAFNFGRLLIAAPSGLLIEPPIVSEAQQAVIVNSGGQAAAVADRIYRINRVARIVTAPRDWHLYLERDWGRVDPPAPILLPKNDEEQYVWAAYVKQGWEEGIKQAEEIFESDVDRMTNDYTGMIRYRELLAQGMISAPYALAEDRGVTGGGAEMRVGDRGITITGQSSLISQSKAWTPSNR